MIKYFLSLLAALLLFSNTQAQKKVSVSGTVKDAKNGEVMTGAVIYLKSDPQNGATVNAYGFYSITLPMGHDTLIAQYIGYDKKILILNLVHDTTINFSMGENVTTMQEVVVSASKEDKGNKNVTSAQMGALTLTTREIDKIPVFFGEKDIMKTLELTPGVKSAGDGNSGFYVRGGSSDQNLVLLDEAPVYNSGHLLGFFSTFNSDAIKDVTLYKGGMPADYGGRLSSVVDVKMKDGNDQNYSVSGGIGLITSRLTVEGPIVKHKGSFMVSGRFAYPGLFVKLSSNPNINTATLYFYDLNLKANYTLGNHDRVFLSAYLGRDVFGYGGKFSISWGNITATARWNHIFNEKLFSNTTFIFNNYNYKILVGQDTAQATILSGIQDISLKEDFEYYPNSWNKIHFGFNIIDHTYIPGEVTALGANKLVSLDQSKTHALETAIYASDEQALAPWFKMIYGVRFSEFTCIGRQMVYTSYDPETNLPTDSSYYKAGQPIVTYWNLEPRLSMNFIINEHNSIKLAYDRNTQYVQQLSNTTSTNPTDLWIPTSKLVKPEISDQGAIGYFGNYLKGGLQPSVEAYYKYMQNQVDYVSGADLLLNRYVESQLVYGIGWAYGVETMIQYDIWKIHGWAAYTWSRSLRRFPAIDNNQPYYAKQDRTHEVSFVGIYDINKKWSVSAVFVFYTGNAVTWPSGSYVIGNTIVPLYTSRNGYRMPDYERLDLGATVQLKKHKKWDHNLNLTLYNALGKENAYSINFQQNPNNPSQTEAVQVALGRWIPSITYNFKFL